MAIILSSTACMPSPFEQNVPSTTWTTNAEGERVQVAAGASTELSANEEIQKVTQDTYDLIFSKKYSESMSALYIKSKKIDEKDKKAMAAFDKEANSVMEPLFNKIDQGKVSDKDFIIGLSTESMTGTLTKDSVVIKVPLSGVEIVNGKGTFKLDSLKLYLNDEEIPIPPEDKQIEFVKVDGEWKMTAESFINPVKVDS